MQRHAIEILSFLIYQTFKCMDVNSIKLGKKHITKVFHSAAYVSHPASCAPVRPSTHACDLESERRTGSEGRSNSNNNHLKGIKPILKTLSFISFHSLLLSLTTLQRPSLVSSQILQKSSANVSGCLWRCFLAIFPDFQTYYYFQTLLGTICYYIC